MCRLWSACAVRAGWSESTHFPTVRISVCQRNIVTRWILRSYNYTLTCSVQGITEMHLSPLVEACVTCIKLTAVLLFDWLTDCMVLTPFLTVLQLYCSSQCTFSWFPGVLSTSTPQNIHSKRMSAFPHNHCQTIDNGERGINPVAITTVTSFPGKNIGRAGDRTSNLLFSSPIHHPLSYGAAHLSCSAITFRVISCVFSSQVCSFTWVECRFTLFSALFQTYHNNTSPIHIFSRFRQ